jgi:hypothetical protein
MINNRRPKYFRIKQLSLSLDRNRNDESAVSENDTYVAESVKVTVLAERTHVVRVEVFTALTMKNVIFWDVMPCGYCEK